jgi:hypothetical protein
MIEEIGRNVGLIAGEVTRKKVMEGSEKITASTSKSAVANWVKGAIDRMDALVDEKTRRQVMVNCGRNCALHNRTVIDRAKARRKKHKTLEEFLAAEQKKPMPGTRLTREDDKLCWVFTPQSFSRPMRCFCGLLSGLPANEKVSRTYCNCSRGFVQKFWESVLEKPVEVDLIQSAVSGASECKFSIRL